jgi:hypothetical protein
MPRWPFIFWNELKLAICENIQCEHVLQEIRKHSNGLGPFIFSLSQKPMLLLYQRKCLVSSFSSSFTVSSGK